jgi:hypothetical protein
MRPVCIAALTLIAVLIPGLFSQTTGKEPSKTIRISARITDQAGAPLSNVTLKCSDADHQQEFKTTTDRNGRFSFSATAHHEYEIYRVGPSVASTVTEVGTIIAAGEPDLDLGNLVLQYSPIHEPIVRLEGPVRIGDSSIDTSRSPSIILIFIGAGGKANVIDTGGKVFLPPKEKDQVGYASPQISNNRGSVGWLAEFPFCCTSYPLSLALVVYRTGKPLRRFRGDGRAIFDWTFRADGKQVAFYQDFPHGTPAQHYELRNVETGRLIEKWDGELTTKAPTWTNGMMK